MCPEIATAAQVLLNHAVVVLAFVWVMVIMTVCGAGFYYFFFFPFKCKINSQISIGEAASLVQLLSILNLRTKEGRKMAWPVWQPCT